MISKPDATKPKPVASKSKLDATETKLDFLPGFERFQGVPRYLPPSSFRFFSRPVDLLVQASSG